MEQIILIDNICMLGHTQGYISVEQLDDILATCTEQYEHGAVYGAIAALAQFGIYIDYRPATTDTDTDDVILSDARPIDVQLPVGEWLKLLDAAEDAELHFAAVVIERELVRVEREIAQLRNAVQLELASDNGDHNDEHTAGEKFCLAQYSA